MKVRVVVSLKRLPLSKTDFETNTQIKKNYLLISMCHTNKNLYFKCRGRPRKVRFECFVGGFLQKILSNLSKPCDFPISNYSNRRVISTSKARLFETFLIIPSYLFVLQELGASNCARSFWKFIRFA